MKIDQDQIADIVSRVVERLDGKSSPAVAEDKAPAPAPSPSNGGGASGLGLFDTVGDAVAAAKAAFRTLAGMPLEERKKLIEAMRQRARGEVENLAREATSETRLGRVETKILKNRLAIDKTPGTEILKPLAFTGDDGITIEERAPYGIIGSITPCTNPVATVISNAIGMIAGGNAVVFNAHPTAKNVTARVISLLNEAIRSAGGPACLLAAPRTPTIQSARELMSHPGVRLLVVTGGPGVVKAAMGSGKKVIAAGPGNPPVVVDETAIIPDAARHIVDGASFDNNIVCVVEKEILCVDSVADALKAEMKKHGAYELSPAQVRKIEKLVIKRPPEGPGDHGEINKEWVGKDAWRILRAIGREETAEDVRLLFFEAPKDHPLVVMEQLMPVIPLVRVKDVDGAIDLALKVEHGFFHTSVMHSTNVDNLSKMARVVNTSIFVKNGPSIAGLGAGGEGYTSFTIASPTGEGLTTAIDFTRERRCTLKDRFRII